MNITTNLSLEGSSVEWDNRDSWENPK